MNQKGKKLEDSDLLFFNIFMKFFKFYFSVIVVFFAGCALKTMLRIITQTDELEFSELGQKHLIFKIPF